MKTIYTTPQKTNSSTCWAIGKVMNSSDCFNRHILHWGSFEGAVEAIKAHKA